MVYIVYDKRRGLHLGGGRGCKLSIQGIFRWGGEMSDSMYRANYALQHT